MDYARALTEHPKWRWEPGMRASYGIATEIVDYGDGAPDVRCDSGAGGWDWSQHHTLDINHPATKGWLLHMLREATGDRYAFASDAVRGGGQWEAFAEGLAASRGQHWQATEGEALAAALLAVWGLPKADDLGTDADRKPVTF